MTFLPYHTASIFKPLLSILPKQLQPEIKFLHAHVNSLSNPSRSVLVHTATSNVGFFTALNDYVLAAARSRHHHSMLLSFWASIVGQTVSARLASTKSGRQNVQEQREDELLVQILPLLSEVLSMKKTPELTLGAYMIIIILVTRAQLSEDVLDGLVEAIVLSWTIDTLDAGLGCCAAVIERKENLRLPSRALKAALKVEGLGTHLVKVSKHQSIQAFASAFVASAIEDRQAGMSEHSVFETIQQFKASSIFDQDELLRLRTMVASQKPVNQKTSCLTTLDTIATILGPGDEEQLKDVQLLEVSEVSKSQADEPPAETNQSISGVDFSCLPEEISDTTMLSLYATELFDQVAQVYNYAYRSSSTRAMFSNLGLWNNQQHNMQLLLLSFYARFWTSSSSHAARRSALQDAKDTLHSLDLMDWASAWQLLAPYCMIALLDRDRSVRRTAADLVLALCELDGSGNDRLQASDTWRMYGQKAPESPGDIEALSRFMNRIVRLEIESCIIDPSHLESVFRHAFSKNKNQPEHIQASLRSVQRAGLYTTLIYHIRETPTAIAKLRLLTLCNSIDKVNGQLRSEIMIDCLRHWIDEESSLTQICNHDKLGMTDLDDQFAHIVQANDNDALDLLLSMTGNARRKPPRTGVQHAAFQRFRTLWPAFRSSSKLKVASCLMESASSGEQGFDEEGTASEASDVLRSLALTKDIFTALLNESTEKVQSSGQDTTKRRKTNDSKAVESRSTVKANVILGRLHLALELVNVTDGAVDGQVFNALFNTLRTLQAYSARTNADLDYMELLVIAKLTNLLKAFDVSTMPHSQQELLATHSHFKNSRPRIRSSTSR